MRVVFLTHHYPRRPADLSGNPLGSLARALMRRGISVRIVTPGDEGSESEHDGVPVRRVRVARSMREMISHTERIASALKTPLGWVSLSRLRRALRPAVRQEMSAGAEVFHAHGWLPAALAAPSGIPLVLTVYGADAALLKHSRFARSQARPLFQRASVVTAVSRQVGNWVQAGAGRVVEAPYIHPMAVDTRGYPWTRGGGGAVVISRLIASQRVELAIETIAVLASGGHDFRLTIIGDGPDRTALELRARRLGVSGLVQFVGARSLDEARMYLERADVMLFTARTEGSARSAIEALVCGVPVVASWDGPAVDVVPESGPGRLTIPSPEAVADCVKDLQADSDRLTMGRLVGESWRARLAPDNVAEVCEGWYRDALAR